MKDKKVILAIDAMGGDNAPRAIFEGIKLAHRKNKDVFFKLFGQERVLRTYLNRFPELEKACEIVNAEIAISGHEKPANAIRMAKNSSMGMAILAVKEKQADASISSGNTGALMAISKLTLRTMPGIHRPAICTGMPTEKEPIVMLDLGANIECDADNLIQFSIMGAAFARIVFDREKPKVGLLNIGSEDIKGPEYIREASDFLKDNPSDFLEYKGFVEANEYPKGDVDVFVMDGFTGNVFLKTVEGMATFISHSIKRAAKGSILRTLGMLAAYPAFKHMKKKLDPRLYNGAMLIGLNGVSMKSHGNADAFAFSKAIETTVKLVRNDVLGKIQDHLDETAIV